MTRPCLNVSGSTVPNPSVQTGASQSYQGAVHWKQDAVLVSTAAAVIVFDATVDSLGATARALTVNTAGMTQFGDVIATTG